MSDQYLTDRHRLRFHGVIKLTHALPLFAAEFNLVGEFEHMERSWIAVQFGGECKAHAAPSPQIGYLLFTQRLDRALLQSGVGGRAVLVLGRCEATECQDGYQCNAKPHLVSSSEIGLMRDTR